MDCKGEGGSEMVRLGRQRNSGNYKISRQKEQPQMPWAPPCDLTLQTPYLHLHLPLFQSTVIRGTHTKAVEYCAFDIIISTVTYCMDKTQCLGIG